MLESTIDHNFLGYQFKKTVYCFFNFVTFLNIKNITLSSFRLHLFFKCALKPSLASELNFSISSFHFNQK